MGRRRVRALEQDWEQSQGARALRSLFRERRPQAPEGPRGQLVRLYRAWSLLVVHRVALLEALELLEDEDPQLLGELIPFVTHLVGSRGPNPAPGHLTPVLEALLRAGLNNGTHDQSLVFIAELLRYDRQQTCGWALRALQAQLAVGVPGAEAFQNLGHELPGAPGRQAQQVANRLTAGDSPLAAFADAPDLLPEPLPFLIERGLRYGIENLLDQLATGLEDGRLVLPTPPDLSLAKQIGQLLFLQEVSLSMGVGVVENLAAFQALLPSPELCETLKSMLARFEFSQVMREHEELYPPSMALIIRHIETEGLERRILGDLGQAVGDGVLVVPSSEPTS